MMALPQVTNEELLQWPLDVMTIKSFIPDQTTCACAYWYKLSVSGEIVYTEFDTHNPPLQMRMRVATFASQSSSRAAQYKNNEISPIEWVDPMDKPFTAPDDLLCIERSELTTEENMTMTVDIVLYEGIRYIHKYMGYRTQTASIELEIKNHQLACGSRFVPKLYKIVKFEGQNRGLLLEYI